MITNLKVILIHGNGGGTAKDHWFPYVVEKLKKLKKKVIAKNFPDPILARQRIWLPFLKNKLHTDQNTILIGHSSGAVAAMRYAEQNKILGSILVGACHTDLGDEQEKKSGYFDHPWNWEAIKRNKCWVIQFASTDDPYVHISESRFIHSKLETEYYEYKNQGHFGGEGKRDKKEFEEIIDVLVKKFLYKSEFKK